MNSAEAVPDLGSQADEPAEAPGSADSDRPPAYGSLCDLAVLLALPAMWVGHEPSYVVEDLLRVLFSLLRLDSAYVRFDDPSGGPPLEYWKPDSSSRPSTFAPAVASAPPTDRGIVTVVTAEPSAPASQDNLRIARMYPALPGEDGLVLAGSVRPDFPTDNERYLLRVAVGQATISLRAARMLAEERAARVAAESALRTRNAFLATLSQDLTSSLATLADHATRAQVLSLETNNVSDFSRTGTPPRTHPTPQSTSGAPRPQPEANVSPGAQNSPPIELHLTRRETEVLGLLSQGLSNKEIAAELWLSERTVERHITGLYAKIGVRRRTEATLFAIQQGLDDSNAGEA